MRTFPQSVLRWIEGLTQDLRYGARHLRRAPGLVAVSVLSLGLGIGLAAHGYGVWLLILSIIGFLAMFIGYGCRSH